MAKNMLIILLLFYCLSLIAFSYLESEPMLQYGKTNIKEQCSNGVTSTFLDEDNMISVSFLDKDTFNSISNNNLIESYCTCVSTLIPIKRINIFLYKVSIGLIDPWYNYTHMSVNERHNIKEKCLSVI